MENITWTIQGIHAKRIIAPQSFPTKREAMSAMEMARKPKTAIVRLDPHFYTYSAQD